jgi:hypothetical protein
MPSSRHARSLRHACLLALLFALASALAASAQQDQVPSPTGPSGNPQARYPRPNRFSSLPPTQPTALPATPQPQPASTPLPTGNALPEPIAATPLANEQPSSKPKRAQVSFLGGQLDVRANDSSLNQILRAISRETGLKITGGVQDQRVFGNYGPASTASVLATLLDGTGTNLLLLEGDATTPPELVLTPRGGGATPPNPDAPGFDDGPDPAPTPPPQTVQTSATQQTAQPDPIPASAPVPAAATSGPQSIAQPFNNINGSPLNTSPTASTYPTTNSVPIDSVPTPSTTPSTSGIVDAPNPPAPGSTTGTAPNGSATPEQVYQQLLKMQQQQQTAPPAQSPAPTTPPQ